MKTETHCTHDRIAPVDSLKPNPNNPNRHDEKQIELLAKILQHQGWREAIVVSNQSGFVVCGHGRLEAARALGLNEVPVDDQDFESDADEYAHMIADNRIAELSQFDNQTLKEILSEIDTGALDMDITGFDDSDLEQLMTQFKVEPDDSVSLAEKFGAPPFSVLDSKQADWQRRKKSWVDLGIKSEVGRDGNLLKFSETLLEPDPSKRGERDEDSYSGTSVFDPVLAELAYAWFCPTGGSVLDPFAGGSVRGIVAGRMGLDYTGIELRAEQVEANKGQAEEISTEVTPVWHNGDSAKMGEVLGADEKFDFVFSCPPYGDLEKYSDDPADISSMDHETFVVAYRAIIEQAVARLKENRFACFVVGDFRDKKGFYRNFVSETIQAFEDCGALLYNEGILLTPFGNLPLRAARIFQGGRKLGKTHQNVLVFYKGNPKKITEDFTEVYLPEMDDDVAEVTLDDVAEISGEI